jgi:serine/threonine protein kinase
MQVRRNANFSHLIFLGSQTVAARFLDNGDVEKISEPLLWSLIVQIALGIRAIHSAGLAHGNLNPNKVVINNFNR